MPSGGGGVRGRSEDPEYPGQIGWFTDNGPVSHEESYDLGGVILELVRRHMASYTAISCCNSTTVLELRFPVPYAC